MEVEQVLNSGTGGTGFGTKDVSDSRAKSDASAEFGTKLVSSSCTESSSHAAFGTVLSSDSHTKSTNSAEFGTKFVLAVPPISPLIHGAPSANTRTVCGPETQSMLCSGDLNSEGDKKGRKKVPEDESTHYKSLKRWEEDVKRGSEAEHGPVLYALDKLPEKLAGNGKGCSLLFGNGHHYQKTIITQSYNMLHVYTIIYSSLDVQGKSYLDYLET